MASFGQAALSPPGTLPPGFTAHELPFINTLGTARYTTNQNLLNGSGLAAGDADGDGRADLFLAGLDGDNTLFHNLGEGRFEDRTAAAGVGLPGLDATGAAFADVDGDGDLDLLVNTLGQGTHLFANDGAGRFARAVVLNPARAGMSLALGDADGDGDLDLYIANYRVETVRDDPEPRFETEFRAGRPALKSYHGRSPDEPALVGRFYLGPDGKVHENGEPDRFYLNDGGFRFTEVSWGGGRFLDEQGQPLATTPVDWGLSCMFRDINQDGAPDLYICNDFESPDRVWLNDGKGTFRALPTAALRHTAMYSMAVDFADIDRDGWDDFFVADMLSRNLAGRKLRPGVLPGLGRAIELRPQYSQNMLFLNRGNGTYAEIGELAGVEASDWTWSAAFLDVDLDGWEDLLVATGNALDSMNEDVVREADEIQRRETLSRMQRLGLRHRFGAWPRPKVAWRNEGGLRFTDASQAWSFDDSGIAHGMGFADFDGDGDLDVAVNQLNGPARWYRNNATAPRIAVRLRGRPPNTAGIGARIEFDGGPIRQSQEMLAGGRYLSGDEAVRVFAARTGVSGTLTVRWRSGAISVVQGVEAGRSYQVNEPAAVSPASKAPEPPVGHPWFADASAMLGHEHHDDPHADFDLQPLLSARVSGLGPGVAWHDLDQDGWEDLIVPTGKGGSLAIFQNNRQGGFTNVTQHAPGRGSARDETGILGLGEALLVGLANAEDGQTRGGKLRLLDVRRRTQGEMLPGQLASIGPLAWADVDGNGLLDLFMGGRLQAGRFPEPADSMLFSHEGTRFAPKQRLPRAGLVSGAVFSDLDLDGDPDLVLACQWGPLRVFLNENGNLTERTAELGLANATGLWNSVATGDFDEDGRPDLVAGNWGLNSSWKASIDRPLRLYFGDFDGNGTVDSLEAVHDSELGGFVPLRGLRSLKAGLPAMAERFISYAAFARAGIEEVLGEAARRAEMLEVRTLHSTVFLNRGAHFEPVLLPIQAQFAPVFGLAVGDLDGDGHEDLFLAQNFYGTHAGMPRQDAGAGVLLIGDGRGGFTPVAPTVSGLSLDGEQRACALADFDHDGRLDLVVTQNSGRTRLFRNQHARPGVRVGFRGSTHNPAALGAKIRIAAGPSRTILKEVQGGAGYWSLSSPVAIVPPGSTLELELPSRLRAQVTLPLAARSLRCAADGTLTITE